MDNVGYRTGIHLDRGRSDWDGDNARPIRWSAWYPAISDTDGEGRRVEGFFDFRPVHRDASVADGEGFRVAMLSHGTGGSPESLGWLAHALASAGLFVIAPHHHGNTAAEPYRPEGFLCWWERATDLSVLLTHLTQEGPFADRLDAGSFDAVGFSLGGHSVLSLAGARGSFDRYLTWARAVGRFASGPKEFPDAAEHIPDLMRNSEPFRRSWGRQEESFLDPRLRSAVALAPAPTVRAFDPASIRGIRIPITLMVGESDAEAPPGDGPDWLKQINPAFKRISLGDAVGHYTLVGEPGVYAPRDESLFGDPPGVDRAAVHHSAGAATLEALRQVEGR